jgi:hypothetical protein
MMDQGRSDLDGLKNRSSIYDTHQILVRISLIEIFIHLKLKKQS